MEGKPHVKECFPKYLLNDYFNFKAELQSRVAASDSAAATQAADATTWPAAMKGPLRLEVLARAAAPAAQAPAAQPAARRSGRARQTPGGLGGFAACMAEMIAVREGRLGRPAGPHGIV